jgi:hypothetical protein
MQRPDLKRPNELYKGTGLVYVTPDEDTGAYTLKFDIPKEIIAYSATKGCMEVEPGTVTFSTAATKLGTFTGVADDADSSGSNELQVPGSATSVGTITYDGGLKGSFTFAADPTDGHYIYLEYTTTCGESFTQLIGQAFSKVLPIYKVENYSLNVAYFAEVCKVDFCDSSTTPTLYIDNEALGYFDDRGRFIVTSEAYPNAKVAYVGEHWLYGGPARVTVAFGAPIPDSTVLKYENGSEVKFLKDSCLCATFTTDVGTLSYPVTVDAVTEEGYNVIDEPSGNLASLAEIVTFLNTLNRGTFTNPSGTQIQIQNYPNDLQSITITSGGTQSTFEFTRS